MKAAFGSHVMIVESELAKTPENLSQENAPDSFPKLYRSLLAMRLTKPGFVSPGRIFFTRRERFRYGLAGITSSGYSRWEPGTVYELSAPDLPALQSAYENLKAPDNLGDEVRALNLALRASTSIYGRDHFRAEDRLVDAITAIEASLRLDTELSFRSSFQVAGLLAADDEERVTIFREMRTFYDTRNKVVHGGLFETRHTAALQNYERLIDIVRQMLAGFVRATASGNFPEDFYEELDAVLQHNARRAALRASFGWP